ncbi:MAG: PKD domain-containing protein [Bacteroidia bacterium]
MKTKSLLFALLVSLMAFSITSCNSEDPIACFTYELERELSVQFLNCSESASFFEWSFGDGNTGEGINPVHTYANAGTYIVKLTAYFGQDGESASYDLTVVVDELENPVACFEASELIVGPAQTITFFNCSKNSGRFEWDFGDGNTSTEINAEHSFSQSGNFLVTLKAYSADGNAFDTASVSIKVGDKYITAISLVGFPETNNGETWDPELPFPLPIPGIGPQPDIKIIFTPAGGSETETDVANDITTDDLPYEFELGNEIKIDEGNWIFTAQEDDGVFGSTEIGKWQGSLAELGNDGVIELEFNNIELELSYIIK